MSPQHGAEMCSRVENKECSDTGPGDDWGAVTPRGEEEAARAGRPLRVAARVVTYNLSDVFPNARRGLLAQTRPLDELIVVDNASTDGTSDMLAAEFPTARQAG